MLEVPKAKVAARNNATANPVIGVWSTTTRPTLRNANGTSASQSQAQVSRLGQPLVNEVVVPAGLKDAFNSIPPARMRARPAAPSSTGCSGRRCRR